MNGPQHQLPPSLEWRLKELERAIERGKRKAFWVGVAAGFTGAYLGILAPKIFG